MAKQKVGVIGGGIVGTAVAYNLSLYDHIEPILFEKDQIGSGTTAKSAGTVCLFDDLLPHWLWETRLYGFQTYVNMEKAERGAAGFDNTGTLAVCTDESVEAYTKTGIALAQSAGYNAEYITEPDAIRAHFPDINLDGVLGAGWTPDDGYFDPTMAANTFAKKMRNNGGLLRTYTRVERVITKNNKVTGVDTDQGPVQLDLVVDASGPWTR